MANNEDVQMPSQDAFMEKCLNFAQVTQTDRALAMYYLQENNWDLDSALSAYYLSHLDSNQQTATTSNNDIFIDLTEVGDSLDKSSGAQSPSVLNILSWNVEGLQAANLKVRTQTVIDSIQREQYHVVCLQEVIDQTWRWIYDALKNDYEFFGANQNYSSLDYFVAILVRKNSQIISSIQPNSFKVNLFPNSVMGRHVISVDIVLSMDQQCMDNNNTTSKKHTPSGCELRICTSHLESCREYAAQRVAQLQTVWSCIQDFCQTGSHLGRAAIFCGDLNLRDKEITQIGGLPPGIIDTWEYCGSLSELKHTWDPRRNTNAGRLLKYRPNIKSIFRYDRMYVAGNVLEPIDFGLRGIEKVDRHDCHPSDHWAILGRFVLTNNNSTTRMLLH